MRRVGLSSLFGEVQLMPHIDDVFGDGDAACGDGTHPLRQFNLLIRLWAASMLRQRSSFLKEISMSNDGCLSLRDVLSVCLTCTP